MPLLFSAAGRLEPASPSLAAAFTLGYTGFIVEPPAVGILADQPLVLAVAALGGRATASKPADHSRPRRGKESKQRLPAVGDRKRSGTPEEMALGRA